MTNFNDARMNSRSRTRWTPNKLVELGRSYQSSAVYAAAAELEVFTALAHKPLSASQLARILKCSRRGLEILLDALAALKLLSKSEDSYQLLPGLETMLTPAGTNTILGMAQHQANCMRRWAQLARVVKNGRPARREPSIGGERRDQKAFIEAMHNISAPIADSVIRAIRPLAFEHLLDVGGASGTWTIAFLKACKTAKATIFDLPEVIPMGRRRLAKTKMSHRVKWVAGDFLKDGLPGSVDLAWVSAIIHQNSLEENRILFRKVHAALAPGGRMAIRDVIMEPNRIAPMAGALFAINMLVSTEGGRTYQFSELKPAMESAGFIKVSLARRDAGMNSVLLGQKKKA